MAIVDINDDNLIKYGSLLGVFAESIGREYYHAICSEEGDDVLGYLLWQLIDADEEADTRSEIKAFYCKDAGAAAEMLEAYNSRTIKFKVVSTYFELPYDTAAEYSSAFEAAGFSVEAAEGQTITVTVGDVEKLPMAKKKAPDYIKAVSSLVVRSFRKGITNCMFHGCTGGLLPDVSFLPISWYETEVSCYVETDGKANGFLLVHKDSEDKLEVQMLYAFGPDYVLNVAQMVAFAMGAVIAEYSPQTEIRLRRHNKATAALAAKLFPGVKGEQVLRGKK